MNNDKQIESVEFPGFMPLRYVALRYKNNLLVPIDKKDYYFYKTVVRSKQTDLQENTLWCE